MNHRRSLVVALGATAFSMPGTSLAQDSGRVQRVAVLMGFAQSDAEAQLRLAGFKDALAGFGWVDGRNLRLDVRWTVANANRADQLAKELVALQPDVILAATTPATAALQRETKQVPIVFVVISDPVGSGFVESLARPGGNITGFVNVEAALAEKWMQLLKQIAPRVTQAAVMFNPEVAPYAEYYLRPMETVAARLRVKTFAAAVRNESDLDTVVKRLGREPDSGLVVMVDSFSFLHRKTIIALAASNKVPTIYALGKMVEEGGLISYGVEVRDQFRRAATYVDRILRGAKPAELPVQLPATFELFINRKTAQALGLTIPQSILISADKIID